MTKLAYFKSVDMVGQAVRPLIEERVSDTLINKQIIYILITMLIHLLTILWLTGNIQISIQKRQGNLIIGNRRYNWRLGHQSVITVGLRKKFSVTFKEEQMISMTEM